MPNPDLPDQPDLEFYRKQAKALLKAYRAGDPAAQQRIHAYRPDPHAESACGLSDAQLVIARECGCASWPKLKQQIETQRHREVENKPLVDKAIAAIGAGDTSQLRALLAADPTLIHQRAAGSSYTLLHHAACGNTLRNENAGEVVETLLHAGFPVDTRLAGGETALHFAASLNHVAAVRVLLAAGSNPELDGSGAGGTPLIHALFYGCVQAAEMIAAHSLAPNNLRVAAGLGRLDLLRACFDTDGTLTAAARAGREFYRPHDEYPEWTPADDAQQIIDEALMYACNNGRVAAAEFLLRHGAHINAQPYLATGLHFAAYHGHNALIDLLLERGAYCTIRDNQYHATPWGWAWFAGHEDIKLLLLERAVQTDLQAAVVWGKPEPVRQLIERGATGEPLEATQLEAALATALEQNNVELIELLRAHGARPALVVAARHGLLEDVLAGIPAAEPGTLQAAFDAAATAGERAVCYALRGAGASLTIFNAAALDLVEFVAQALAGGAEIDEREPGGRTALHRAIAGGATSTVRLLLQHDADVDISCNGHSHGPCALQLAATTGASPEIIDQLIAAGADINDSSNDGTPLDCAERMRHTATAAYLRQHGGKTGRELNDWPHNET